MRKLFLFFVALLATSTLWAYDFQSGDLYYNITNDSIEPYTVEVTYKEWTGLWEYNTTYDITTVVIPSSVTYNDKSYLVTCIGYCAFYGCEYIDYITIPNSVTSIGDYALCHCKSLNSITIPTCITQIGSSILSGSGVYNNESNWDSWNVLYIDNCLIDAKVESYSYEIRKDTRLIASSAFHSCNKLHTVKIPDGITNLEGTFWLCTSLEYLSIPASVTNLDGTFGYCSSLTSITIPNSVTSIGDRTFEGCSSLTSITIPESVTSIGSTAFSSCSSLTSITIPNSVTSIGYGAFQNCSSLTSITIPNSVMKLGGSMFYECSNLQHIVLSSNITSLPTGGYTYPGPCEHSNAMGFFGRCSSLVSINIPNGVTSIDAHAFCGCSSLTSITIPESVTSIGYYALCSCMFSEENFVNNSSLDAKSNGYWGAKVFDQELNGLLIRNDTVIGCRPFVTSITIPNSVTNIGDQAFYNCSSLKSIYCKALTPPELSTSSFTTDAYDNATLHVPFESYADYIEHSMWGTFKNIQYIDTFYNNDICYQYIIGKEILSKTLTAEDDFNAFTNISITGTQTWHYSNQYGAKMSGYNDADSRTYSNEDWLISPAMDLSNYSSATLTFSHAFGPRSSIPTTDAQKAQYTCWVSNDFNGDVTTASWTELPISYGTSAWNYISTVVDIPTENLKENCCIAWKYVCTTSSATWEIKSVEVGGSYTQPAVKVIAKNDKYSNDIVIPSVVTHNYADYDVQAIAANAFSDCASLTSATIGNNVTSIASSAFSGCTALNEITLPASVKSIGENAFAGCTKLYDIYCFAMEPPTAYESSFANYNAFLHVPCDNQRVYLLDVVFGEFKYIECIEAETATTDTVVVDPSFNDAEFTWPSNSEADSYTLAISKDGEIFCTLTFNANGQLTGIAFAPARNRQHNAPAAVQTANGFAFTVTGLDEGANYTYELLIQDRSGNTLLSYSGEFRTQSTKDRTVTVEYDAAQGQVTGAGTYLVGDTVTLTATPNDGYRFVRWSNEVEDNPYTFVISDNVKLSAEFEAVIHSSVENTHSPSPTSSCQKIFRNGQLIIIRDGKTYNAIGQEM